MTAILHAMSHALEQAVGGLCARLFEDPTRVVEVIEHEVSASRDLTPHVHEDLLQLDLFQNVKGSLTLDGQRHEVAGLSLLAIAPGRQHGYQLRPEGGRPGVGYHVKIRAENDWPVVSTNPLPEMLTGLAALPMLISSMQAVHRLFTARLAAQNLLVARLAEALCLWPWGQGVEGLHEDLVGEAVLVASEGQERLALSPVLKLIESRLSDPPSLSDMARLSHLSPRHFARRFVALMGCTPHAFVTAKRLERAKRELLGQRMTVQAVGDALGFSSPAAFTRWFSQHVGKSPSAFRDDPASL